MVYSRYTYELEVYTLAQGFYKQLALSDRRGDAVGIWLAGVGLGLGVWEGAFEGMTGKWLRFYDAHGNWCARPVEQERQKAERERQRAERLAEKLRTLGIDPNAI